MKIVLDTNILIDGAWDEASSSNKIIEEVLAQRVQAYANRGTRRENKLLVDKTVKDEEYKELLEKYFDKLEEVEPIYLNVVPDDPEDNKILGSAVAAEADYLITSDWDLLQLEEYEGIKIVTPGDFWKIYSEEELGESGWQKFLDDFIK